jgi:hypothetical protein
MVTGRDEGIDTDRRAVLVRDQAVGHSSPRLAVPEGIPLVVLPSSSPNLQPAERLWPAVDESVANRAFADLDTLETVLLARCRTLEAEPQRLKAQTHFPWWPPDPLPGSPQ